MRQEKRETNVNKKTKIAVIYLVKLMTRFIIIFSQSFTLTQRIYIIS